MNNIQVLVEIENAPFLTMGIIPWSVLCLIVSLMSITLFYCWKRIRKLTNLKAELDQQVVEKTELLSFSIERERKALESVTQANQTKQQLLSRINHEIRTPMNGVIGMSALMAETGLTNEQAEYNETIRSCGESLLTVINDILHGDLLAHSKVESGMIDIEQKDFDLRNSVEEVLAVFAGKVAHTDVELLYQIHSGVPAQIIADSKRIRQVLMNIVENAVTFTQHGEVVVSVHAGNSPENNPANTIFLRFEIKDTGVGIAAEKLKLLQQDLSHGNKVTNRPSGVGLYICQKLVAMMGGELKIQSSPQGGTTVWFTVPVTVGLLASASYKHIDSTNAEGKHVLIVGTNATARDIMKANLEHWKLQVTEAGSGKQALEILSKGTRFDMILTDLRMPAMNGIELAKTIREQFPKVSIVLLSKEGDELGKQHPELFTSIVNKPLKQDVLNKHIIGKLSQDQQSEQQNTGHILSVDFAQQHPLRILIAEDNRVNQKLAMKILCKLGYNPDIAEDGKAVLEMVGDATYDLVLMDVQMPEMDGLEATRMIRLCLPVQPVIVAMTANSMQGDREECLQAGMDDYISKPVHLEELVIILERWALAVKEKR